MQVNVNNFYNSKTEGDIDMKTIAYKREKCTYMKNARQSGKCASREICTSTWKMHVNVKKARNVKNGHKHIVKEALVYTEAPG